MNAKDAVIHLYTHHHMTPAEISQIMEMKVSKIKVILHKTRPKKVRIQVYQSNKEPDVEKQRAAGVSPQIAVALITGEWH